MINSKWGAALGAAVWTLVQPLASLATTAEEARALEDYLTPAEVEVEELDDLGAGTMGNLRTSRSSTSRRTSRTRCRKA
jgi:hypothetical protein